MFFLSWQFLVFRGDRFYLCSVRLESIATASGETIPTVPSIFYQPRSEPTVIFCGGH